MDISLLFDLTQVGLVGFGILVTVLTGVLSRTLPLNRSLQLSSVGLFLVLFGFANIILGISTMRIVIPLFLLFAVVPFTITLLGVWLFSKNTTPTRIQISAFIGWWMSLGITLILRLLLGHGGYESTVAVIGLGIALGFITGCIGCLIGHGVLRTSETVTPNS